VSETVNEDENENGTGAPKPGTESGAGTQPDTGAEPRPETEPEMAAEPEAGTSAEAATAPELEAEPETATGPEMAPEPEPATEPETEAGSVDAAPDRSDERAQHLRLLEGLLFASPTPMSDEALAVHFPAGTDLPGLLAELANTYAGRGVNVARTAGGWTFRTAPDLGPRLRFEKTVSRRLSRAAVETLAIIAYHQPITRAEVEEIRGVALGKGTLDALMESGWIKPGRRRETPGRPVTWVTTDGFLEHFGLNSLTDLPGLEELKAAGLLDARPTSLGDNPDEPPEGDEADDAADREEVAAELGLEPREGDGQHPGGDNDTDDEERSREPVEDADERG
jgi:segregation and condensation protein B